MTHALGTWFRWLVLSSLLFAAIGSAEPPQRIPIEPGEVIVNIAPDVLKRLSPEGQQAVAREVAEWVKAQFTYDRSTMIAPPAARVADAQQIEVTYAPVDAAAELEASVQQFEATHPDGRLTPEMKREFRATSIYRFASTDPNVENVYRIRLHKGHHLLHKGADNIAIDFRQDVETGLYEVAVHLPDSVWSKNDLSVKSTVVDLVKSLKDVLTQMTGEQKSVPAFSKRQADYMVRRVTQFETIDAELQRAALAAFEGNEGEVQLYHRAMLTTTTFWEEEGEKKALEQIASELADLKERHGLDPETERRLTATALEAYRADYLAKGLLEDSHLAAAARSKGIDLRMLDEPLMVEVRKRLTELEALHDKQWAKIEPSVSSQVYSELLSRHAGDPVTLAQATVNEVMNRKQGSFFGLILRDTGLDTCHPRANGIGRLLVEIGLGIKTVHEKEQEFAKQLEARRSEYEDQVRVAHPVRTFISQKYLDEKTDELLTKKYQEDRNARYRAMVGELNERGLKNAATLLSVTLTEMEEVLGGNQFSEAVAPARSLKWENPTLGEKDWLKMRKVKADGTWDTSANFDRWVTTHQSYYRLRAFAAATAQAYRVLRRHVYLNQWVYGPFGLRAWIGRAKFAGRDVVDAETGQLRPDDRRWSPDSQSYVFDEDRLTDTWLTNMAAWNEWRLKTLDAPRPTWLPQGVHSCYTVAKANVGAMAGMVGWTASRAVKFALLSGVTAVTGSRIAAGIWAPISALMATGFSHAVYDQYRARGTYLEESGKKVGLDTRAKWLALSSTAAGFLTGGYLDYLNWADSTWTELARIGGWPAAYGLAGAAGLALLSKAEGAGFMRLPSKLLTGVTFGIEKVMASVLNVPARLAVAGRFLLGQAIGLRAAEHARDFMYRDVFRNFFVDRILGGLGGSGLTVRSPLNMDQIQGIGVGSQHFYGMSRSLALGSLWATLEQIDLNNWAGVRSQQALEPRRNLQTDRQPQLIAITGTGSIDGSPVDAIYDRFEAEDAKFREEFREARMKLLAPLITARTSLSGKIRFTESELALLRAQAAQLTKRFFEEMALSATTPEQKEAMWHSRGIEVGNWQGLADKLLVETFGEGVLQSFQSVDRNSYAEVQQKGAEEFLQQLLDGRDLDTSASTTLHSAPSSLTSAQAGTPFLGATALCARDIKDIGAVRLPWVAARLAKEAEAKLPKPERYRRAAEAKAAAEKATAAPKAAG